MATGGSSREWVTVDLAGLRKTLMRNKDAKVRAGYELWQNAMDEDVTEVRMDIGLNRGVATLIVTDDSPEGFKNLADAYTLFAESYKKTDPTKRGAFNAGEKFVLALCESASVTSTKGRVQFHETGRTKSDVKRERGTEFRCEIPMTQEEYDQFCEAMLRLIVPEGKKFIFNGELVSSRPILRQFEASLMTMIADDKGLMHRRTRKTVVKVYEVNPDEPKAMLYEMGIPVVETGDKWHVDIQQKVPLNIERDNVLPAFLRDVRVAVLNAMSDQLTKDDVTATWVKEAAADEEVDQGAFTKVMDLRFGQKRVIYDPSDPEANARATAEGYTLMRGTDLDGGAWKNAKNFSVAKPAGQVTPSAKPYAPEGGRPLNVIPPEKYTEGMKRFERYARWIANKVLGRQALKIEFVSEFGWNYSATYGPGHLTVNKTRCGNAFFEGDLEDRLERWSDLLVHEYGHEYESNHLSSDYYHSLTKIAGKLVRVMREDKYKEPKNV